MEIIEKHFRKNFSNTVYKISNRAGGKHNAEDVVQTAYTRAWQYRERFDETKGYFDLWFNSILNNCLRDHYAEEKSRI